jgi:hypothetical protein
MIIDPHNFHDADTIPPVPRLTRDEVRRLSLLDVDPHPPSRDLPPVHPPPYPLARTVEAGAVVALVVAVAFGAFVLALVYGGGA